ncbi:MAG: NAD+ synthase [bacterium]
MSELPMIDCEKVTDYLVDFLRKQLALTGLSNFVVGISGGIDSAVVACLAVRALGKDHVHGFFMPFEHFHTESALHVQLLADYLAINVQTVDITDQLNVYFSRYFLTDVTRRGNKMARERMAVLFDQSKQYNALVVGTSNKTETLLGYGTLFGDGAWSLNPIGDLYKTHIRALAQYLGVPEVFITKPPSAGLWEGQTDEGELGYAYALMDKLLYHALDLGKQKEELLTLGFEETMIDVLLDRVQANAFKSKPAPVAFLKGAFY